MSTAIPQIPPRPSRAHHPHASATDTASSLSNDIPKIPPRPANRRIERSMSPSRESFARSPLNETTFLANHGHHNKSSFYSTGSANASGTDLQRTSSNVALPSIGQEGNEYAEVFGTPDDLGSSPTQTRNVANDLKLHAPKPSLPQSSAKARVSAVTRTDSGQAAAYGIGKAASSDDKDPGSRDLKTKASFASQVSNNTERRPSSAESDHGIPEIGQRVPMYPDAGDVQAPSPAPFAQPYAPGVGFHNDGSKPRHHGRRTSARGNNDLPLEAYGKHGHGVVLPHDRFEKAYYEKHPELIKKELDQYHERPAWAMSSDDLNKIVRDSASRGSGLGTSGVIGTPSEQIGFQAAEEYASRMSSPRPQSAYNPGHPNVSDTHVESPLRKESFPADVTDQPEFERTLSRSLHAPSEVALSESELEDEDVIHVDAPDRRLSKIYSNTSRFESTESLGQAEFNDEEYSAPILASDEVAKEPFGWDLQPAVSPMNERRGSADGGYHLKTGSASSLAGSRPTSRPGSIHGILPGLRMTESTPLEDLEEYEPLFPEDERTGMKKPLTAADRLRRPELKNRKFPSQDIWEDAPNSLKYTATVSTPELPESNEEPQKTEETPEQAFARRQEELAEQESEDSESFLNREKKPWSHKSHLVEETRPGLKQRFPSRDVWEDTPDSLQLQTTVGVPQSPEKDLVSPPEERPTTGAVAYHQEKAAAGFPLGSEEGRATTGLAAAMKPQIPARPAKSKHAEPTEKQQPSIPERPSRLRQVDGASPPLPMKSKPQVPARPSKPVTRESSENIPLTQVKSNSSAKSFTSDQGTGAAAAAKPKPPVPSRPVGSKIAALQGGFMSDLNKRLQLGPQAPKKEEAPEEPEVEKEKVPLVDARKGRARGPARRAPAKSPAPLRDEPTHKPSPLSFCMTSTFWSIDPEKDYVLVPSSEKDAVPAPETKATQETPTLATNTVGEKIHEPSEIAPEAEKSDLIPSASEDAHAVQEAEAHKEELSTTAPEDTHEPVKQSDEPPAVSEEPEAGQAEDLSASTGTVKA